MSANFSFSTIVERIAGDTAVRSTHYYDRPSASILVEDGVITDAGKKAGITKTNLKKWPDYGIGVRGEKKSKKN